ncbi:MAG: GTPase [Nanoarchaeota archaeon]
MPINAHPEYLNAEKKFHQAQNNEEKILALEEMIRFAPSHKGGENLRKNLRSRYKKLKEDIVKIKKGKKGKKGIKKADMQAILLGFTNSGKSSILKSITNAEPKIASYGFTTIEPMQGSLNFRGCNIQIIDTPPIASENFEKTLVYSADTILIVVEKIHEIENILDFIKNINNKAKKIIVFNKIDQYDEETKRKITETLKTRKHNFILTSTKTREGIDELKEKILNSFDMIRIYTKHSGKKQDEVPTILKPNSNLKDVAEKILHGYSEKVKYAKIWGPSSKFSGQKVGLKHIVKDKDTVEFFTE